MFLLYGQCRIYTINRNNLLARSPDPSRRVEKLPSFAMGDTQQESVTLPGGQAQRADVGYGVRG